MSLLSQVTDLLSAMDADAIVLEGYDAAIIGLAEYGSEPPRIAYSYEKIIEILMQRDGMDHAGAVEFFYYNIDARYGPGVPVFVRIT